MIKDYLLDIVKHTQQLSGAINTVKITGTDDETRVSGIAADRSLVLEGVFNTPIPEFKGVFGIPDLNKLNVLLNIPEYQDNAIITVDTQKRNDEEIPVSIHFENEKGDFKNDYRLMPAQIITAQVKEIGSKVEITWDVEIRPTESAIKKMKFQSQANSEVDIFRAKTQGGDLKFYFGDNASHAGNFIFHSGIKGQLTKAWSWPIARVLPILNLTGDIAMKFSEASPIQIIVDSGLAKYTYLVMARE